MSVINVRLCDFCGEPIEPTDRWATLSVAFGQQRDQHLDAAVGDYHFDRARQCWAQASDAVLLTHEFGGSIEHIPVASGQKIAQLRRKHAKGQLAPPRLPDGGDDNAQAVAA